MAKKTTKKNRMKGYCTITEPENKLPGPLICEYTSFTFATLL
jgi:hypothetical protein